MVEDKDVSAVSRSCDRTFDFHPIAARKPKEDGSTATFRSPDRIERFFDLNVLIEGDDSQVVRMHTAVQKVRDEPV